MNRETVTLEELASILQRDVREVSKMASRGNLPGRKVGGEWRFACADVNFWIATNLHGYSEADLHNLETGVNRGMAGKEPLVTAFMSEATMAVPLAAGTRASVLKELVGLAEQSWHVYDPDALFEAVKRREDMASTAQLSGVALPHPHRPNPSILGDHVIAYARTSTGIPFGGDQGILCDLFFLICCRDLATHMRTLARLSRILLQPNMLDDLRAAETVAETYQLIEVAERELIAV